MADSFTFERITPILRIFSVEKAKEFYCDFLGCKVDWEHRYEDGMPLFMQVSRAGLVLHLSEHHGDCCPGVTMWRKRRWWAASRSWSRAICAVA